MIDIKFNPVAVLQELHRLPIQGILSVSILLLPFAVAILVWRGKK